MSKEFKIVKILDEYNIIINAGEKDVGIDDILSVLSKNGIEVRDPDGNALLGTIQFPKAIIRVKEVYEKMSICENSERKSGLSDALRAVAMSASSPAWVPAPLNIDVGAAASAINEVDEVIRIGDVVKLKEQNAISSDDSASN